MTPIGDQVQRSHGDPLPTPRAAAGARAPTSLPRVLRPIHLWAIAVGLVISGDYFGWNYGLARAGPLGMVLALVLTTLMYVCFIFSFTELSTSIPHSGGPYAYARRALGPGFGLLAGVFTLIEFVFAPPAIALSIGSYVHFRAPALGVIPVALLSYLAFVALNCWGVHLAATVELFVTTLAVLELCIYFGITLPHVRAENIVTTPLLPFGLGGVFAALPFAIWFYLALEGVAMSAEEVVAPRRDIPIGFTAGLLTLVALALGTLICTSGVLPWTELVRDDSPLPRAMASVLSQGHWLTHMMVYIGLFGLLASFHGIMMGYSRQVYALARAGYLPGWLAYLHPVRRTPVWAVIVPALFGMGVVLTGKTDAAITLSVLGAVALCLISMVSLFVLRRKDPDMPRPFRAPLYPYFPALSCVLALVCLVSVLASAPAIGLLFLGLCALGVLYYRRFACERVMRTVEILDLQEPAGVDDPGPSK